MPSIEEEIAQRIDKALNGDCGYGVGDHLAAALVPLLNRVRAEAVAQALNEAADEINKDFQSLPSWNDAWQAGERTADWERGCTRTLMDTIDWLRARAALSRIPTDKNEGAN